MKELSNSTAHRIVVTKEGRGTGPLLGASATHWLAMAHDVDEAMSIVRRKAGEVTGFFPQQQTDQDDDLARHQGIAYGDAKAL